MFGRETQLTRDQPTTRIEQSLPLCTGVAAKGAKIFKAKCAQCHVAESGGGHKQVRQLPGYFPVSPLSFVRPPTGDHVDAIAEIFVAPL